MLEFRDISVSDKQRITAALSASDFMGCEYSFANNMAWKRLAGSKIAFFRDFYICCAFDTDDGLPHFIFPAGSGNYEEVINELRQFANASGAPLIFTGVTGNVLSILNELFPGEFTVAPDRDSSDYIYRTSDLIELPGRKYHSKRNHLTRFNHLEYEFSIITEKDFDDCILFSTLTFNDKYSGDDHSYLAEQYAINTFFNYYGELDLTGGIIRIGGRTAAFTIGEKLNCRTFCVHIEKADVSFNGIYAGINNCFVKSAAADFEYINREEDMGLDGLRRSKLSYHPAFILEKNIVTFK
jgi:hypothetical protein